LSELRGWAKNPRKMRAAPRAGLRASLEEFGCVQPIVANRIRGRWEIVSGHQRHRELLEIGWTAAPCVTVRLSAKKAAALALTLNNHAIEGEFTDGVAEILKGLRVELPDLSASLRLDGIELPGIAAPAELERFMAVFKRKWGPVVAETRKGRESVNPLVKWPVPGI
jgi:hypothetical protein